MSFIFLRSLSLFVIVLIHTYKVSVACKFFFLCPPIFCTTQAANTETSARFFFFQLSIYLYFRILLLFLCSAIETIRLRFCKTFKFCFNFFSHRFGIWELNFGAFFFLCSDHQQNFVSVRFINVFPWNENHCWQFLFFGYGLGIIVMDTNNSEATTSGEATTISGDLGEQWQLQLQLQLQPESRQRIITKMYGFFPYIIT